MFIVEGMDNSGKSTLIETIATTFKGFEIRKFMGGKASEVELQRFLFRTLETTYPKVIYDRHCMISEVIYGKTLRNLNRMLPHEEVVAEIWDKVSLTIYCRPPADIILESLKDRPQMDGVIERASRLIHAYDYYFEDLKNWPEWAGKVIHYDYTTMQSEEIISLISHTLNQEKNK